MLWKLETRNAAGKQTHKSATCLTKGLFSTDRIICILASTRLRDAYPVCDMKTLSPISLLLCGISCFAAPSIGYTTHYFTQNLDHFDFAVEGTFQQRYLLNTTNWAVGGPVFFYTGNEGDITLFAENTGTHSSHCMIGM